MNTNLIGKLETTLARQKADLAGVLATARTHNRALSSGEQARADKHAEEITAVTERIAELREQDELDNAADEYTRSAYGFPAGGPFLSPRMLAGDGVSRNESTYRRDGRASYFLDLFRATKEGDSQARERLDRNRKERAESTRALSTTTGGGGEFVPPLWLEDEWIALARAGRTTTNLLNQLPMPPGTDVVNIPKVNTGTATALQGTQNTAIQQTDMTTTSVASGVFTVAGGATISMQLAEQSPGNADQIVLKDLAQDYNRQVGNLSVNATTGTGSFNGLLASAGNTVAYVDAAPALMGPAKLYSKIAQAKSLIETTLFLPPNVIIMHPRRWDWICVQVDNSNRPAVLPGQGGPFNASAVQTSTDAQGSVGMMFGLPVVVDPQIPVNGGGGTNQDTIILARTDETWFWEGDLRLQAFQQTYAAQLSLFLRCYNYIAQVTRRNSSIAIIQGTGLVTPVW